MSSADNLEELDNASLRAKCKEYGLPNVPITDTSKKILIKRLRAAIDGTTDTKKTKNRRETIAVTKIPTPVEAPTPVEEPKHANSRSNNRRTTIAATSNKTTEDVVKQSTEKPAPLSQRRRSSRPTPVHEPEPVISKKRSTAFIEEEDDDDDLILIEAVEQTERPIRSKATPRGRKSSSPLTTSPTVTTSYNKESAPPTLHETESETEYEIRDAFQYDKNKPFVPSSVERDTYSYSQAFKRASVEPEVIAPYKLSTSTTRYSAEPERIGISKTIRTSVEPEFIKPYASRYSSAGNYNSANTSSSTTTRRFTTGTGTNPGTSRYSTYVEESDLAEEEEDDAEPIETPYYSDFARRLERLKSAQFSVASKPRDISAKRDTPPYYASAVNTARNGNDGPSIGDTFRNFIIALDHKYKLKQKIFIALSIFILLTIYVFIFH